MPFPPAGWSIGLDSTATGRERGPAVVSASGSGEQTARDDGGMRVPLFVFSLLLLLAGCAAPPQPTAEAPEAKKPVAKKEAAPSLIAPSFDAEFWGLWGDGQAEISSYRLTIPRYGEPRPGIALTIFVTEPFLEKLRVKADSGAAADAFPVLKLNLIKDFQTGIYDYNEMTSSFVGLKPSGKRPAGALTKASFSSQEWCGHVYHQLLFGPERIAETLHSYFEGEADNERELVMPADGVSADQLPLWARGMAAPAIQPGQQLEVAYLPSLEFSRHAHKPLRWGRARLLRELEPEKIVVPAGRFDAEVFRVEEIDGFRTTYWVQAEQPRLLLKWESSSGEEAEMVKSARLKYWELNGPDGVRAMRDIGLPPPVTGRRPRR